MKLVKVGKVVNTHGIKGEIRIMSGSRFSNNNFSPDYKKLIIDNKEYNVTKYRLHKNFHQVFLEGYNNINDVLFLKEKSVYVENDKEEIVDIDSLIGLPVLKDNKTLGIVTKISHTKLYKILVLDNGNLIPLQDHFVEEINKESIKVKNL